VVLVGVEGAQSAAVRLALNRNETACGRKPRDMSSLRLVLSAGDAPPDGLQAAWAETFSCELNLFWASTEAIGSCTYGRTSGAVSRLIANTDMRLVDHDGADVTPGEAGEMLLRGPHVMLGYWQSPGLLSRLHDGWFRSGDLMRRDADGAIWFVGRLKDLIVRGVPISRRSKSKQSSRRTPRLRRFA